MADVITPRRSGWDLHEPLLEQHLQQPHLADLVLRHDGQGRDGRAGDGDGEELATGD